MSFATLVFGGLAVVAIFWLITWLLEHYPLIVVATLGFWVWLMAGTLGMSD